MNLICFVYAGIEYIIIPNISKYQYVNIRYFQYYIIETMFFASVFKKTCKISQKNKTTTDIAVVFG